MRKRLIALVALAALAALATVSVAGCWMPVQIDAPSDNTVYVLDHNVGSFSPAASSNPRIISSFTSPLDLVIPLSSRLHPLQ